MENNITDASGPTPEFVQLLTASQSALYAFIVSLLGGVNDAHDVLQEANMKLCRKCAEYDPNQPFLRWAYAFARFEVFADELEGTSEDADQRLKVLETCMERMTPRQRELIAARYGRGEAVQDIASRLSSSENAMAALFYRLRKMLADCVQSVIGNKVRA
jgi:RNA polymerase sigma-70 factor (ECF subfamily)